jgi:multiple sugar transport system substrate-binding protein
MLYEVAMQQRLKHMKRRSFLERLTLMGLVGWETLTLLEACSNNSRGSSPTLITWMSEHDSTGVYSQIVDAYNKSNQDNIHVIYMSGARDTEAFHSNLVSAFEKKSSTIDILSMDVIWPAEFAARQWTLPINDRWPSSQRKNYLASPIDACTFDGRIWAVPYRTDAGLIYYRSDLVATPPSSWEEMSQIARQKQSATRAGYVWQGARYEGLLCNFVEVLYSYGGSVLDPADPHKVTINSPQAHQALDTMVSWIGTISPESVTTFKEEEARLQWENDRAIFMRNWPYAYSLSNDASTSKVAGRFDVRAMLAAESNGVGHSCIGGWQLGINALSHYPDEAWKFIEYMISPQVQRQLAFKAAFPTLVHVYDDAEVLKVNPFFKDLKLILQQAKSRPVSPYYSTFSPLLQASIYQALEKQIHTSEALKTMQSDLERIISR